MPGFPPVIGGHEPGGLGGLGGEGDRVVPGHS